ncbi:multidrug MFS transporter [Agaricicola taiwanensis]|uniref:Multidrug MFS transporter n=1 Tax=Agaricicola taiwanensis TaxID=591372 RepID=A0A8J2VYY2_9RHOB|nr:MFS transporter [Agaricicola taiwanensis]GGE39359.1 multidrug MFS transporter [Agaricicola taiwanensis]
MKPPDRASATPPSEADGLPVPQRYWSALAIWLAIAMSVLDAGIANVALPTIAAQLDASAALSVWIINAYQLAVTVLLLPLAAMGDRIGYRRVYLPGLAIFVVGSLGCALAESLTGLIAARVFQGIGAACVMSINAALVRATYPSRTLGRGLGYNALVVSVASAVGPTVAALILSVGPWPWLFAINVPVGLLALAVAFHALPRTEGHGRAPDYLSAILSAVTLGLIMFGAETLAREGAGTGLPLLAAGFVCGTVLVRREWHRPTPLVPLDLLRIRVFSLSIATSITSFAAQMLAFVSLPFLFQSVLGRGVVETGFLMTPWPLAVAFAAPIAGRLADRYSAGLLGGAGLAALALGLFSLSMMGDDPSTLDIAWRMVVCGLGFGFFQAPNNRAIVSSAPRARSGAAGGMLATARLLGQTTGAVSVAAGFHWLGVGAAPTLLQAASVAAAVAAVLSLLRHQRPSKPAPEAPVVD